MVDVSSRSWAGCRHPPGTLRNTKPEWPKQAPRNRVRDLLQLRTGQCAAACRALQHSEIKAEFRTHTISNTSTWAQPTDPREQLPMHRKDVRSTLRSGFNQYLLSNISNVQKHRSDVVGQDTQVQYLCEMWPRIEAGSVNVTVHRDGNCRICGSWARIRYNISGNRHRDAERQAIRRTSCLPSE